jgi:hypothetical protein
VTGILDFIGELGGRITSTKRDPNSPLGRANPRSYHNVGQAVDVAPIPGLTFDQYVQKMKGAGYQILEARDEVNNPSKHATGPHWHIAYAKEGDKGALGLTPQQQRVANMGVSRTVTNVSPDEVREAQFQDVTQQDRQPMLGQSPMMPGEIPEPQGLAGIIQPAFNNMTGINGALDANAAMEPEGHKGMFPGKDWKSILGIIADGLAVGFGGKPGFAPAMQARQEQKHERRLLLDKLEAEKAEKASTPRYFQNNAGDQIAQYSDGRTEVVYMDPVGKTEYARVTDPTSGEISIRPYGSAKRPAPDDVADLVNNPALARDFDAEFGPGAAEYVLRRAGAR